MQLYARFNPTARCAAVLLSLMLLCFGTLNAHPGDLPAAGDGLHLWLVQQAPTTQTESDDQPRLVLYHLPAETQTYQATPIEPVQGKLMPRGLAAGDGRLLLVTDDRQLTTVRPVWSELTRSWAYQKRSLPSLPEGCTLLALAMGERGPWALVRVQSYALLKQLDNNQQVASTKPDDQRALNQALGLPEELRWDLPNPPDAEPSSLPQGTEQEPKTQLNPAALPSVPAVDEPEVLASPEYRLISLHGGRWASSPLPEDFEVPRDVAMVLRPGEDRPTLLVGYSSPRGQVLLRYNPVDAAARPQDVREDAGVSVDGQAAPPPDRPSWVRLMTGMQLIPGRQWSAAIVSDQLILAQERYRSRTSVTIDTFLLRSDDVYAIGEASLSLTDDADADRVGNARWALVAKQNHIGMIALASQSPAQDSDDPALQPLAFLSGMSLDGQPIWPDEQGEAMMMPIIREQTTLLDGNADLLIQILALITAMIMMVMFYRRSPEQSPLDLPEHLVLASFSRRLIAGIIDLTPGFVLASMLYDISVNDTILYAWPGNGVEKAFAAMRPGFVVIGVTLLHTTIMEFILARSIGKILMGLYVADLNGKPAPPLPCFGRAISRAFELFAPLMILVAVISPARQRLGDILARTTVVMQKPEEVKYDDNDDF